MLADEVIRASFDSLKAIPERWQQFAKDRHVPMFVPFDVLQFWSWHPHHVSLPVDVRPLQRQCLTRHPQTGKGTATKLNPQLTEDRQE